MMGVGDCSWYGDRVLGEGSANQSTQAYGHNIYDGDGGTCVLHMLSG